MSDEPMFLQPMQKTLFAANIKADSTESFDEVFLLDSIRQRLTGRGKPYWTLSLRDRTGEITAKAWSEKCFQDGAPPPSGAFVKVRATAEEGYRDPDQVELRVSLLRQVRLDEGVLLDDFVPTGPNDRFEAFARLRAKVDELVYDGALKLVALKPFDDPVLGPLFRDAPAAKSFHQPYIGGLVDHVANLVELSARISEHYGNMDVGLLVTAAVWHDIGKTRELDWAKGIRYSREGQLVGHVVTSLEMLERERGAYFSEAHAAYGRQSGGWAMPLELLSLASERWDHLRHILASHHGNKEWGAAALPQSREAMVFHEVDMIDSLMGAMDVAESEPLDADGFTPWMNKLRGPAWLPSDRRRKE